MSVFIYFLFPIFLITSAPIYAQETPKFPYKGEAEQLEKEISSGLLVEALDSGRIYFVEIYYQKESRKIVSVIHGKLEDDITTSLIADFFQSREKNWEKRQIKKMSIIIPLFIPPLNIDQKNGFANTDIALFAKRISDSFISKRCFLSRPIYIFKQDLHIDKERN